MEANRKKALFEALRGGLVVSCQALVQEPLHSPYIMGRMALAAKMGGASGIRANSPEDIREIKRVVSDLPLIGLWKVDYPDSPIYITPTLREVEALVEAGADIIATDATARRRPRGLALPDFFAEVRARYPHVVFMADCATLEEGLDAAALGFDCVGTTMSGYTEATEGQALPDYELMRLLATRLPVPVVGEGGIWSPEQLAEAYAQGIHCAVVGTAITRPMDITARFAEVTPRNMEGAS